MKNNRKWWEMMKHTPIFSKIDLCCSGLIGLSIFPSFIIKMHEKRGNFCIFLLRIAGKRGQNRPAFIAAAFTNIAAGFSFISCSNARNKGQFLQPRVHFYWKSQEKEEKADLAACNHKQSVRIGPQMDDRCWRIACVLTVLPELAEVCVRDALELRLVHAFRHCNHAAICQKTPNERPFGAWLVQECLLVQCQTESDDPSR